MHRRIFFATLLALAGLAAGAPALAQNATANAPTEVAGVKFDNQVTVGGTPLQLNGAGVRYKAFFKVYAAGLYLPTKSASPEAAIATTTPRRIQIVMLRDIDANELGKLFTRGMEQNASREEFVKVIPATIQMGELFAAKKKLATGEFFSVDFVPNVGTTVVVNGKPALGPIKEPEFFSALMKIWLGKSPADWALKDALLGVPRQQGNLSGGQ